MPAENDLPDNSYDDLTQIKGIGEVTQQWLRTTFAVRTYRDLVMLSSAEIEERLKADGRIATHTQIDDWLGQARELADSVEALAGANHPITVDPTPWKTFSTFVVMFEQQQLLANESRFQTKVHHMEADNTQTWQGIAHAELIQWLLAQLGSEALQGTAQSQLAPPQELEQTGFSDELKRYAAKAQTLAGEQAAPLPGRSENQTLPQSGVTESALLDSPPYSGKLQQLIRKVRTLAGDR